MGVRLCEHWPYVRLVIMAMNRLQFLLTKLAEESNEVSQMALKTQQFGLEEKYLEFSNRERLYQEITDFLTIIKMLNDFCDFGYVIPEPVISSGTRANGSYCSSEVYSSVLELQKKNNNAVSEKIDKVLHYYNYSRQLGMVEPT